MLATTQFIIIFPTPVFLNFFLQRNHCVDKTLSALSPPPLPPRNPTDRWTQNGRIGKFITCQRTSAASYCTKPPFPLFHCLDLKLIAAQLVKKFRVFYGIRRFITVFTRTRQWSLSWARWFLGHIPNHISLRCMLILSSHLCLGIPINILCG
jgi:hypothetical protein